MVVVHRRRCAVAERLAHIVRGISQQFEAVPRGVAAGVLMVHLVAYRPDGEMKSHHSFCKQSIAGPQQIDAVACLGFG